MTKRTDIITYATICTFIQICYLGFIKTRRICSSGGIGYEVGKKLISQGFKVCGVLYNSEKERAEHYIATSVEELIPSIGSKYIQSYTVDGFKAINRRKSTLLWVRLVK